MSELFKKYLDQHPDLCPKCAECKTFQDNSGNEKCHNGNYPSCWVYKRKTRDTSEKRIGSPEESVI